MKPASAYPFHLLAAAVAVVWGTTFISTKVLLAHDLSPARIFALRFLIAYAVLIPFARGRLRAATWRDELCMAGLGITGGSLYFLTENIALRYAPAANVALLVCTAPLVTLFLLRAVDARQRLTARTIGGSLIALCGVALVVLNGHFVLRSNPLGDGLALAASLLWAAYSLLIRAVEGRYDTLFLSRKTFFYGLLTILPVLAAEGFGGLAGQLARPAVWGNLLFLGLVASLACYALWNIVLRRLGTARASNYLYLNPLAAMICAAAVLGEPVTGYAATGSVLILTGLWLAQRTAPKS